MEGEMEKSDDRLPRRKFILKGSAALLLMSLFLAIFFNTLFESPWRIVAALLVLGAQTALSLFCFDAFHSSIRVERQSLVLDLLSIIVFVSTFILTASSRSHQEVVFTIYCVYAVWGGIYEIGMNLGSSTHLCKMFSMLAMFSVTIMMRQQDSLRCAWLILIPTSLAIGMTIWKHKFN